MHYNQELLVKAEYDRMVKSVPSVPEYPPNVVVSSPIADWFRSILMSVLHLVKLLGRFSADKGLSQISPSQDNPDDHWRTNQGRNGI